MTSPNAIASSGVPARADGPSPATSSFSSSGWRDENKTWCPALTQSVPTVLPILPEPMIPIFVAVAFVCAEPVAGRKSDPAASEPICRIDRRLGFRVSAS